MDTAHVPAVRGANRIITESPLRELKVLPSKQQVDWNAFRFAGLKGSLWLAGCWDRTVQEFASKAVRTTNGGEGGGGGDDRDVAAGRWMLILAWIWLC